MLSVRLQTLLSAGAITVLAPLAADASSHREAPFISELPKVDGTDFYMFRSYEDGRDNTVTLIANYVPLEDPFGGPNYFALDPEAIYEIHIDNDGDAVEDLTFQFRFNNDQQGLTVDAGGVDVEIPLVNIAAVGPGRNDNAGLNVIESFEVSLIEGGRDGDPQAIVDAENGEATFLKPVDNIGTASIPDYEVYAQDHIRPIAIPGCEEEGRVFVGQRKEAFSVNLGQIFDLLNFSERNGGDAFAPIGIENNDVGPNVVDEKSITSLALEVPIACLIEGDDPVIGGWTTSSIDAARVVGADIDDGVSGSLVLGGDDDVDDAGVNLVQVSRLGNPLVNEVVIGLGEKDNFNSSEPVDDGQFAAFVTNPTLPELIEIVFGGAVQAPNLFPRVDLVAVFLTGFDFGGGANTQPLNVVASEQLRLNTATPPTLAADQNNLGVIGGDVAGFPNGRRPGDDVVDIALTVVMGRLINLGLFGEVDDAPNGDLDFTDGATISADEVDNVFPYLVTPLAGNLIDD